MRKDDSRANHAARQAYYVSNKADWINVDLNAANPNLSTFVTALVAANLLPHDIDHADLLVSVRKELQNVDKSRI